MASITIGGREVSLPAYKTNLIAEAAEHIDKVLLMSAKVTTDTTPEQAMQLFGFTGISGLCSDLLAVIAVGTQRVDPTLTAEKLGEHLGIGDLPALQQCFAGILADAGLGGMTRSA